MLICICNGQVVNKVVVIMFFFKLKVVIVNVLKEEGFIEDFKVEGDIKFELEFIFKYFQGKVVVESIQCVSCSGLCIYKKKDELLKVMVGLGIVVVFIFKGVMIDCVVCQVGFGGEIICYVV